MKLFVPGRLCLFGEHSDWAGEYRLVNPDLEKGYAVIVGTNQGIYAQVKPHLNQLILSVTNQESESQKSLQLPMTETALLQKAQTGDFFSYAAGVAYQLLIRYRVGGININNYLTDLPIQKGLSSSAAICVLVARAFNRLYGLQLTIEEEMELAYLGERTTPSRCGRMDQACAYGNQPILMVFDGDPPLKTLGERWKIKPLKVAQDLFLVIVDLGASKDTQIILQQLNQCYPFAANRLQRRVQQYLGRINSQITLEAASALAAGDAERIGRLMVQAQTEFDRHLIPACPAQLKAPVLHQILNYEPIKPYVWGGKGVGSQGDGTAQFIVKERASQQKVIKIIESNFPQMQCLKLTIEANQ